MYAIIDIIYGSPLPKNLDEDIAEKNGFEIIYSGTADYSPGFIGERLTAIDQCDGYHRLDLENGKIYYNEKDSKGCIRTELLMVPTEEQKESVKNKIESLPKDIQEMLSPIGIYFIWGTS